MPRVIHARRIPTGMRFREWSPERGAYMTAELSQPLMREYLLGIGVTVDDADTWLRRALVSGSSDPSSKHDPDKDWEKEKTAEATPTST